jgi:hypothetical protein
LKIARKKATCYKYRNAHETISRLFSRNLASQREWDDEFKRLNRFQSKRRNGQKHDS